jgi:hypothetical protein
MRYYRSAREDSAVDASPPVLELEGKQATVEFGEFFSVPATGRPANPLAIVDVAFFVLQVGRLRASLQPLAPRLDNYTRWSPGKLVAVPDAEHVLSRFLCPGCSKKLWAVEDCCDSCDWDLHTRHARPYTSPYDYEYDGN